MVPLSAAFSPIYFTIESLPRVHLFPAQRLAIITSNLHSTWYELVTRVVLHGRRRADPGCAHAFLSNTKNKIQPKQNGRGPPFDLPNLNSWVDSRWSVCAMGKWSPPSVHAYFCSFQWTIFDKFVPAPLSDIGHYYYSPLAIYYYTIFTAANWPEISGHNRIWAKWSK